MMVKICYFESCLDKYLKNNISDEENKYNDGVSRSNEYQINSHPGDNGDASVGSIHQADTVQEAKGEHESSINTTNDLPLLLRSETIDASIISLIRDAAFQVVDLRHVFLSIVRRHDGIDCMEQLL